MVIDYSDEDLFADVVRSETWLEHIINNMGGEVLCPVFYKFFQHFIGEGKENVAVNVVTN